MTVPDCFNEDTLLENKLSICIGYVRAEVLLHISVHVIVDPDHFVLSHVS